MAFTDFGGRACRLPRSVDQWMNNNADSFCEETAQFTHSDWVVFATDLLQKELPGQGKGNCLVKVITGPKALGPGLAGFSNVES